MLKQSIRWFTIAQEKGKIGSKVFQMIIKQQPFSILNLLNRFSYSPTQRKIDLNTKIMEQKAIVAFYTLQYIQKIDQIQFMNDNRSLRQRIFSLEHLTKNLLNKAIQYRKKNQMTQQDPLLMQQIQKLQIQEIYKIFENIGFDKNNILDIIKAYDLIEGIAIDCKGIWQQQRFVDALSPNGKMVLLPNFGTKIIFNQITSNIKRCIISGDKGSGKSFAYLNYEYLSKFITNYRIYLAENKMTYSEMFLYLIDKDQFQKVKRLFYFPLKQVNQYQSLQRTFEAQIHFENKNKLTQNLTNMQKSLKLQNFLTSINNYFFAYKIDTVCVTDEANAYLSAYRQLLKQYSLDRITLLERYSNIFNCVKYKFSLLIYNSSQEVQAQELHYWSNSFRDSTGQTFHDPYEHDKQDNHLHIPYNQFLSYKTGHIVLYSLLWDQLCKQLAEYKLEKNSFVRQVYTKMFGIPSLKAPYNFNNNWKFLWWLNDVRHLNIRFIVKNKLKMQKFRNYLQNSKKSRVRFLPLIIYFGSIRKYIIKHRQETLIRSIIGYLEKSPNDIIKTFRFALLQTISQTKQKQILKQDQCPQIEVDFTEIIQNFTNTNPSQNFLKQANDFPLLLGFGHSVNQQPQQNIQQQNIIQEQQKALQIMSTLEDDSANSIFQQKPYYKTKFRFLVTSSLLDQVTNIIAERQDDFLIVTANLLNLQILEMDFAGRILDILYYRVFHSELQQFQVSRTTRTQIQHILFKIEKCMPFHVNDFIAQKEVKFEITLEKIINQAINNQGKLILGFQTKIVKVEPNFPQGHKICTKNPLFDFVIIKAKDNEINIQSFDATIGALEGKIVEFKSHKSYDTLKEQIERISKKFNKKVIWNYNLLTFQYQIKQFQKINVRQDLRVMFVNNLQSPPQKVEQNPLPSDKEKETKFVGLNEEFGKLKLGLSMVPFLDHFTFSPLKRTRDTIFNQMKKLAKKVEEANEIEKKK